MESKNHANDGNAELQNQLFTYATNGDNDKVREFVAKGYPLGTDTVGTTALHCAVVGNHPDTCLLLLKSGIVPDTKTKVDRTPLHLAAYYGHKEIVKLLLDNNCKVDPIDMLYMTPLHWAVEKGFTNIAQILLRRGANPNAVSKFDKTPRSIAESRGYVDLLHAMDNQDGRFDLGEIMAMSGVEVKGDDVEEVEEAETEEVEEDVVEVIPAGDCDSVEITLEQSSMDHEDEEKADKTRQDSDESFSHLQESISKLENIKGLKPTDAKTLKMLQSIGIQLAEDPDPSTISNALQSGRRIVLSEAGKYILNRTKSSERLDLNGQKPQTVPMASSTPLNVRPVSKQTKSQQQSPAWRPVKEEEEEENNVVLRRKRPSRVKGNAVQLRNDSVSKLQLLEVVEDEEMDEAELLSEEAETQVPLMRMLKMEKQILSLTRENQILKNKLEMSLQLIEENRKRLERLEGTAEQ